MARVVLVYPSTGLDIQGVSVWLPLSVLQVASTLVADHDVAVIDQRIHSDWQERLRRAVDDDTLCVGVSAMTGTQIKGGLAASRAVRALRPGLPIVWGGIHPTLAPESTARHPLVDIVAMGEGERTFRRLVDALAEERPWKGLPDIAYKDGEGVVRNGTGTDPGGFIKPEEMPPLPYRLLDVEAYISGPLLFGKPVRSLPYIGSRGCPHSCAFCCQPILSGGRWRAQPPELLLERTLELQERFRLDAIEFHDEEFFADRGRGERIARMIGGRYEWYVQTRMDDILALDCGALYRDGLRVVQPGLETGSARILAMLRKRETLAGFEAANRRLAASGIRPIYNFMMGYPTETAEDLTATVDLALKLLDENPGASVSGFYVYVPYPGSELFDLAVRKGFEPPRTLEGWAAFNRQHLASPWMQGQRDMLETLLVTSKFIDSTRLKRAFQGNPLLAAGISMLSADYRRRWRRHRFAKTPDIGLLSLAARRTFDW